MSQYFYRLGHIPELACTEFEELTNLDAITEADKFWMVSDHVLDVNKTGSLVYGGKVSKVLNHKEVNEQTLGQATELALAELKEFLPNEKKLGFAVDYNFAPSTLIRFGKDSGFKKINTLNNGKLPNFGNWKGTNAWVVGFRLRDLYYIGFLTSYADQEFWTRLDDKLPNADMRRGIINFKLARSLQNMVKSTKIWDPFCGQGRVLIAAADLKKEFFASDIDSSCLVELRENWEQSKTSWQRKTDNPAELKKVIVGDAMQIEDTFADLETTKDDLAIVTEGYLGFNFNKTPNRAEMDKQLEEQENLWFKVLTQAAKLQIKELVFCLPFYTLQDKSVYPQFVHRLSNKLGYEVKCEIKYRRKDTITGHFIVHIISNN